jgi:hypothetical protein
MVFNILVHSAETDVIRVFDDKLHLTEKKMQDYLKQAGLEKYGFEKTVEVSTETDENGKTKKRKPSTTRSLMTAPGLCFGKEFWTNACQRN